MQPSAPPASANQRIVLRRPGEARTTPRPVASAPAAQATGAPTPITVPAAPAPQPAPAPAPAAEPERPTTPPPAPEIAAAPPPPAEPAPEPAPQPAAPAPQPEPSAPQAQPEPAAATAVASLPWASGVPTLGNPLRVAFEAGSTQLSSAAQQSLGDLAAGLRDNPEVKIQLNGFASAPDGSTSQARRTALLRTLAVRTFLIDAGVERLRMDVRALGDRTELEPKDRVDIEAIQR